MTTSNDAADVLICLGAPFDEWVDDLDGLELAPFEPGLEHREGSRRPFTLPASQYAAA